MEVHVFSHKQSYLVQNNIYSALLLNKQSGDTNSKGSAPKNKRERMNSINMIRVATLCVCVVISFGTPSTIAQDGGWLNVLTQSMTDLEGPVMASSQTQAMLVYSDRTNVYYRMSIDDVSSAFDARVTIANLNKVYSLSLAAATNEDAEGTYMLALIDDGVVLTYEYRNGGWFKDQSIINTGGTPASCAVAEGGGEQWVLSCIMDRNTGYGFHYASTRDKYPSTNRTWSNFRLIDSLSVNPDLNTGHWSGNPALPKHEMTCNENRVCSQWIWDVLDTTSKIKTNVMDRNLDGDTKYFRHVGGAAQGSTAVTTPDYTAQVTFVNWQLSCWIVSTSALMQYANPASGFIGQLPNKSCPQFTLAEPIGADWSVSLSSFRHNKSGVITLVLSLLKANSAGTVQYRKTVAFQSYDDFGTWSQIAEDLLPTMTYTTKDVRTGMALSGKNWLTFVAAGDQFKVLRLPHALGAVGITSQAPQTGPATNAPISSPMSTLSPTIVSSPTTHEQGGATDSPTTLAIAPSPSPASTVAPSKLPTASPTGTSEGDSDSNSTGNGVNSSYIINAAVGVGAAIGFMAALAIAHSCTFAVKFGDDMGHFVGQQPMSNSLIPRSQVT